MRQPLQDVGKTGWDVFTTFPAFTFHHGWIIIVVLQPDFCVASSIPVTFSGVNYRCALRVAVVSALLVEHTLRLSCIPNDVAMSVDGANESNASRGPREANEAACFVVGVDREPWNACMVLRTYDASTKIIRPGTSSEDVDVSATQKKVR